MANRKTTKQFFAGVSTGMLILTLCISGAVQAEESQSEVRQGLASKYKGDKGIENAPEVIFAENFEENSLDAVRSR